MSVIYIHYGKRELKPCTVTFIMWLRPLSTLSLSLWNTEKDGRHVTTSSYCTNQRQTIQNTRADVVIAERNRTWEQYIWGVLHLIPPDMSEWGGVYDLYCSLPTEVGETKLCPSSVVGQWNSSVQSMCTASDALMQFIKSASLHDSTTRGRQSLISFISTCWGFKFAL